MIGSVKDQNKELQAAGKKPVDTSHRTVKANTFSAKVASSGAKNEAQDNTKLEEIKKAKTRQIKGSYEGLMHSSSAVLQFSGAGYDNKNIQSARYGKNISPFSSKKIGNPFNSDKNYSIMNNYSRTSIKNSSSFRLNNIIKDNMGFK